MMKFGGIICNFYPFFPTYNFRGMKQDSHKVKNYFRDTLFFNQNDAKKTFFYEVKHTFFIAKIPKLLGKYIPHPSSDRHP